MAPPGMTPLYKANILHNFWIQIGNYGDSVPNNSLCTPFYFTSLDMQQAVKAKREDVFIRWAPPCCFLTTCTFENPFWNFCIGMCIQKKTKEPFERGHPFMTSNYSKEKRTKKWWCIGVIMRWNMRRKGQKKAEKSLRHLWKPQKVPLYFYLSFTFSLSSNLKISLASFHLSINIYLFWMRPPLTLCSVCRFKSQSH